MYADLFYIIELVQHLIEDFIHPTLGKYRSDVFYTGSSYEYCGIQDSSDYDLQFCIKMPQRRYDNLTLLSDKPYVELCEERPGWAMIRGGPPELLTEDGYMSAVKVSKVIAVICFLRRTAAVLLQINLTRQAMLVDELRMHILSLGV